MTYPLHSCNCVLEGEPHLLKLRVRQWQEGAVHYAKCPALDVTGYGYTANEALHSFDVMIQETLAYAAQKGTLAAWLVAALAWHAEAEH
jgi:hypothetical protein